MSDSLVAQLVLFGFAVPILSNGIDLLIRGEKRNWSAILLCFIVGIGFAYGGAAVTGVVTPALGREIADWMKPITRDPRWAILVWFIVLCWLTGPRFVERLRAASVNALHLADEDSRLMEQRVHFVRHIEIEGDPKVTGTSYVEFHQQIINASVFSIEFEDQVEGRLAIDHDQQEKKLEIAERRPAQSLIVDRARYRDLIFRQYLTSEIAESMRNGKETVFDFGYTAVYFTFTHRGSKRRVRKALGNQVVYQPRGVSSDR